MRRSESLLRWGANRPVLCILMLLTAVAGIPLAVRALEVDEPNARDRQSVRTIAKRMKLFHLSNHKNSNLTH